MSKWDQDEKDLELARNMRRYCNGAFGSMSDEEWDHRVVGTRGSYRGKA